MVDLPGNGNAIGSGHCHGVEVVLHDQLDVGLLGRIPQTAHTPHQVGPLCPVWVGVRLGVVPGVDPDVLRAQDLGIPDDLADALDLPLPHSRVQVVKFGVVGGQGDDAQSQAVRQLPQPFQLIGVRILGDAAAVSVLHHDLGPVQAELVEQLQRLRQGVLRGAHGVPRDLEQFRSPHSRPGSPAVVRMRCISSWVL